MRKGPVFPWKQGDAFALRQICARKWPRDPLAKRNANIFNQNFTAANELPVKCVKTFAATLEGRISEF